jgi:cation diffusion facilitator CzcD-associated flavoprotein CzcO
MSEICVIGAGAAGIAAARALTAAGLRFDWYEQAPDLGGIWRDGVYDSVHLISSRNTSGYPDAPMSKSWPNFPHREHVLQYLNDYADRFDLRSRITFRRAVNTVASIDKDGAAGWTVVTSDGRRDYGAVVIANGHLRVPRLPDYPGQFTGKSLHSSAYRCPSDLEGRRILVVGAGNSGCDIAVEAAQQGFDVSVSVRRGHWFLPKTLFGRPRAEALPAWLPAKLQLLALRVASRVVLGPSERYGLPAPRTSLSTEPPVVSSQLFHYIDHGQIRIYPEVTNLEGAEVAFVSGLRAPVDTIVWATGFNVALPFLHADLLQWRNGIPLRVAAGTLPPNLANLYFIGLVTPGGGNFPVHHAQGQLLAEMIKAQRRSPEPLATSVFANEPPTERMYFPVAHLLAQATAARRAVAKRSNHRRSLPQRVGAHDILEA